MTKPTLYTATAPDGSQHTRKSPRTYTHAVLVKDGETWGTWGWCGRPDLAEKTAAQAKRRGFDQVHIAPAETA